eukprot:440036_1
MGNSISKKKKKSTKYSLILLVMGYIHSEQILFPRDIISLCCKYHGYYLKSVALKTKTLQINICSGHHARIALMCCKNGYIMSACLFNTIVIRKITAPQIYKNKSKKMKKGKHKWSAGYPNIVRQKIHTLWPKACDMNKCHTMWLCNIGYDKKGDVAIQIYEMHKEQFTTFAEELCKIDGFAEECTDAHFMDDIKFGEFVLISNYDGCCYIFDIEDKSNPMVYKKWTIDDKAVMCCSYFIYSKQKILIIFASYHCCYMVDFYDSKQTMMAKIIINENDSVNSLDVSPTGKLLVVASDNSMVFIYDISKLKWENKLLLLPQSADMDEFEFMNGIELICTFKSGPFDYDQKGKSDAKFINDKCIAVSSKEGIVYYLKLIDDEWQAGVLETFYNYGASKSCILAVDGNTLFVGTRDGNISVHDLTDVQ